MQTRPTPAKASRRSKTKVIAADGVVLESYSEFLNSKAQLGGNHGFDPLWMPDFLFPFQAHVLEWALRKGKAATFLDCGMGKTPVQLSWAQNVVQKTNKPVLILAPLSVSGQTVRESEKFGIESAVSRDGLLRGNKIVVTNYERLHYFSPHEFAGVVCDESSILKNFDGKTKASITDFMRLIPYRLLCTATAAPNDYIELGTSSEALGEMGYMDMLGRFFKSNDGSMAHGGGNGARRWSKQLFGGKFRFRGHAERDFWRWVCSWARAARQPSDLGFSNEGFALPPLNVKEYTVKAGSVPDGFMFPMPAHGLAEQRAERRATIEERCELAAKLANESTGPIITWCNLNDEGDLLEKLIPDSIQVAGADEDEAKEEAFEAFCSGQVRALVSKCSIAGFGLNFQHCAHQTYFPSHSFEQWYQGIRRSWRFGQKNPVQVDVITSEGESNVLNNLQRKAKAAEEMFSKLVTLMGSELRIEKENVYTKKEKLPMFLNPSN